MADHCDPYLKLREIRRFDYGLSTEKVFVDESRRELLVADQDGNIYGLCYDRPSNTPICEAVIEGWNVNFVRFSPNGSAIATRVDDHVFRVKERETATYVSHALKPQRGVPVKLLGFEWLDDEHILVITTVSVEILRCQFSKRVLKPVKSIAFNAIWYKYERNDNLVIAYSSRKNHEFTVLEVLPLKKSFNKVYKFNLWPEVSEADLPLLAEEDCFVLRLYDRPFICHTLSSRQEAAMVLLSKDKVEKLFIVNLRSGGRFRPTAVDNVLIIHNLDTGLPLVYEVRYSLDAPLVPPLFPVLENVDDTRDIVDLFQRPLLFFADMVYDVQSCRLFKWTLMVGNIVVHFRDFYKSASFLVRRTNSKEVLLRSLYDGVLSNESLTTVGAVFDLLNKVYFNYIVAQSGPSAASNAATDVTQGSARSAKTTFDLPSKSVSPPTVNRTRSLTTGPLAGSPALSDKFRRLSTDPSVLSPNDSASQDQSFLADTETCASPPPILTANPSSGDFGLSGAFVSSPRPEVVHGGYLVIEQQDVYLGVFYALDENEDVPLQQTLSFIMEYVRSLHAYRIPVQYMLFEFLIRLLIRQERFHYLHQFLQYHVIAASVPAAMLLFTLESIYPPAVQLALDMLHRLHRDDQIVEVLLARGRVVEALEYITMISGELEALEPLFEAAYQRGERYFAMAVRAIMRSRPDRLQVLVSAQTGSEGSDMMRTLSGMLSGDESRG